MVDRPAVNEAEVAKALLQEYVSARQEIILHVQLYKTQFRNVGIVTAIAAILTPLLIGEDTSLPWLHIAIPKAWWGSIALLIVFTISTATLVMAYSTLASLYAMQVLGVRCERLENQINECLRGDYLIWEHFVGQIWGPKNVLKNPDAGVMVLFYVFFLLFAVTLPFVVVAQILCIPPSGHLYCAAAAYVWYLISLFIYAVYMNIYTMGGGVRRDIRKLMAPARPSRSEKPKLSAIAALVRAIKGFFAIPGVIALFVIMFVAVVLTWVVLIWLRSTCS